MRRRAIPASKLPLLAQLFEVFSAALGGDWGEAQGIRGPRTRGHVATLAGHADAARARRRHATADVAVQGGRYVNSVEVTRVNGDRDHIEFSQQVASRDPIDGEASELLAMASRP